MENKIQKVGSIGFKESISADRPPSAIPSVPLLADSVLPSLFVGLVDEGESGGHKDG